MIIYQITVIVLATLGAFLLFREVIISQQVEKERTELEKHKKELQQILLYDKDPNEYLIQIFMYMFEINREEAINMKEAAENSTDEMVKSVWKDCNDFFKNIDYNDVVRKIKQSDKNLEKMSVDKMKQRKILLLSGIIFIVISAVMEIYLILM